MHILANKVTLKGLREIDLLCGDVDEMYEAGLGAIFQPHGLGHLLGIDVHDVGGYLEGHPDRPLKPGVKALRTARNLEVGMALTVEPGCYFIEPVLYNNMIKAFFFQILFSIPHIIKSRIHFFLYIMSLNRIDKT